MSAKQGLLIVVSGPSGVGKTTITHELVKRLDAAFSVSMTTRPPASKDREGLDYYFVNESRFRDAIENGELLEWAKVFDRYYGTPRKPVEQNLAAGRDVILEIDVNGGKQVKAAMPQMLGIFILPPSEEDLVTRLRNRGREDEAEIQRRFRDAQREIAEAKSCGAYDYFVVNENLDKAIEEACDVVQRSRATAARDGS